MFLANVSSNFRFSLAIAVNHRQLDLKCSMVRAEKNLLTMWLSQLFLIDGLVVGIQHHLRARNKKLLWTLTICFGFFTIMLFATAIPF